MIIQAGARIHRPHKNASQNIPLSFPMFTQSVQGSFVAKPPNHRSFRPYNDQPPKDPHESAVICFIRVPCFREDLPSENYITAPSPP